MNPFRHAVTASLLALVGSAVLVGSASAHNNPYPYPYNSGYYPNNNTSFLGQLLGVNNQPVYYPNTAYYAGYPGNSQWGRSQKWRNRNSDWRSRRGRHCH
jgi:hypothetical protein